INDVAITLYDNLLHGSVKEDKYSKFVSNFMFHYWKGYFQFREPKEKMLELIPKFMHYRAIHDHIYLQVIWKNININVDQKAYYEKIKNMAHEGFDFLSINHFN
ncbi:MAG TPA: hypothetical protein PKH65_05875, partial [Bacteroidia bacterium]|nr:hypothetical protein [Bacteroidia bacterium]